MTTNNILKKKGFTLIEMLISVAILLTAVVGPISLIGDAVHKLYFAKDKIIATNLAQEGIELVRQKRDDALLSGGPMGWSSSIVNGTYIADVWNGVTLCVSCDQKVYLGSSGYYRQAVGMETPTQFSRTVVISSGTTPIEKRITSRVTWNTGGNSGVVTVSESIFKWATL